MAQTYSVECAGIDFVPSIKPSAISAYHARLRRFRATVTLASQASGDTVVLADIPSGFVFAGGEMVSSVSLGSSTVALGNASAAGKYRAAAVFTAVDTPTPFGPATAFSGAASTATERVLLTVGTATLPASGTLVVDLYFSHPN
jgi:hypothetical protein